MFSRKPKFGKKNRQSFHSQILNLKQREQTKKNIYANHYADTSKRFQGFLNLMLKWKGSVIKLIWHDFLLFIVTYLLLDFIYIFWLQKNPDMVRVKEMFEVTCIFCNRFRKMIPVTFLTGFYVSEVVRRYWDQFMSLPFPDILALRLVSFIPGKDHFEKNLRRTVMRYVNLSIVLVFRLVSAKVEARFPDYESLVHAKLMLPSEVERMKKCESETPHESTWTPILWALKLLERARSEGKITLEPPIFANLVSAFDYIETNNRKILNYGWVNFPLAYVQVATLSVYAYLMASLFGSQFLEPPESFQERDAFPHLPNMSFSATEPYNAHTPDLVVPFFTLLEFFGYLGWIKVAETLLNPFGDDDEDFEINYLIDRNVQVSYMIVDDADMELEMAKDPFLEAGIAIPAELPYQDESQRENSARMVVGKGHQRHESVSSANSPPEVPHYENVELTLDMADAEAASTTAAEAQNEKVTEVEIASEPAQQELTPMTRRNFLKSEKIRAFRKFAFEGGGENSPASAKRVRCNSEMMPAVREESSE